MKPNAFIGKTKPPTEVELTAVLGPTRGIWDQLVAQMKSAGAADREWNSYSVKAGWALRLKRKGRNIVYLSPFAGCFCVSLILGAKAMAAARQGKPSARLRKVLDGASKYPEGFGIRLEIKKPGDLDPVRHLAAIKLAH